MKSVLFFLMLVMAVPAMAQVQQRNQFGPKLALGYYNLAYGSASKQTDLTQQLDSLQVGNVALDFGFSYKRRLTRELSIATGLGLGRYQVNFLENSLPSIAAYHQLLLQVNLPVGLEYNIITENWQPFFGVYLQGSKILQSKMEYILQQGWNPNTTQSYLPANTWLYGMAVSAGAQLPLTDHWTLEPAIWAAYSFKSLMANGAVQRPYQISFQAAVLYNF
jgi:opacity protein-like surface antigen